MKGDDSKYKVGDEVIWNPQSTGKNTLNEAHDQNARVIEIYTTAGESQGDWVYLIDYGNNHRTYVWGYQLRSRMFKYDPKQAGDTEDDI